MKPNILIISFTFLFISSITFGQWGHCSVNTIKHLKNRETIIIKDVAPWNIVEALERKGKLDELKTLNQMYDDFNNTVKILVENYWRFGKSFKFMTWEEFDKMDKITKMNYGVIYFQSMESYGKMSITRHVGYNILEPWMLKDPNGVCSMSFFQTFNFDKAEDVRRGSVRLYRNAAYSMPLSELVPSTVTIAHAIRNIQWYLDKRLNDEDVSYLSLSNKIFTSAQKLQQKKLYILDKWLTDGWNVANIEQQYSFPVKIVTLAELEEAIITEDSNVVIYFVEPYILSNSNYKPIDFCKSIIDAQTGKPLFIKSSTSMILGTPGYDGYQIDKKFLTALAKALK